LTLTLPQGDLHMRLKTLNIALTSLAIALISTSALAQKKYDTGASDKEIKVGGISPYSGPASAYGAIGKAISAYLAKINDEGGINGRKVNFISLDDGYNPAKTVEQARKLVEEEEVLFVFNTLGTPPNSAIHKYMNGKKTPQLFVATGATKWGDPKNFPWTMGWQPNYQSESKVFAAHLLETKPNAKVAILYQNDDYGKDYLKGFEDGLGAKAASMIVSKISYEVTDPTIDSQMVSLKAIGRRHLLQHHHAQVRGPGDQEGRRDRLEAHALPEQRVGLGRLGDDPGRCRERRGHLHRQLPEGPDRPAVPDGQGLGRLPGLHEEVHGLGRDQGRQPHLRLHRGAGPGPGAEAGG
jgi:hypothetical protein